jgi:hypothetical protein
MATPQDEKAPEKKQAEGLKNLNFDEDQLPESEPYLGPAWAIAMLILYLLKKAFPAEEYSFLWWVQMYIIAIVVAVTVFTLVKRRQFYKAEAKRTTKDPDADAPIS